MQQKLSRLPYIICYLCAFVLGMKQLREPDTWWQLLSGRWMLEHGEVTRTDTFSYTMAGAGWTNVKWLYEVLIAFMERGLGPHGVMLLQAVVNVAMVYLLLKVLKAMSRHMGEQVSTLFATIAVLLFLAISEFRMAGRPEMISHLMVVVYMFILWRSDDFSWKKIWWLVPLQCLWANMHEGYPVGMVIIGAYIAGGVIAHLLDKDKGHMKAAIRLGAVWVAMLLAILINPNFTELWKQPFEIFRQLSANKYTTELFSVAQPEYWTMQGKWHIALLAIVCLFWLIRIFQNRKDGNRFTYTPLMIGYLFTILLMGYLSLKANRNIPFAQIVILPSLPLLMIWLTKMLKLQSKQWYRNAAKQTALVSSAIGIFFYVTVVTNKYYKFTGSANKYGIHVNSLHNPTSAADFIRAYKLKGPAFSDYFVSSYLLWSLYPEFKSYIDLRDLDIFPEKFFKEYFDLYNEPKKFYELDSVYKFNYIVFSTSQMASLQQVLYWQEGFNVVHVDPVCMILLRDNEKNMAVNRGEAAQQLFAWPQEVIDPGWAAALTRLFNPAISYRDEDEMYAPIYAGQFYNMVRNYRITLKVMRSAVQGGDLADNPDALTIIGHAYLGDAEYSEQNDIRKLKMDSARMYFERSLALDDQKPQTHLGMAGIELAAQDYAAAKTHLEKYLESDKTADYVYFLNGLCDRNIWWTSHDETYAEDAIDNFETALKLNKDNDKSYLYLAESYWALGNKEKARKNMQDAVKSNAAWNGPEKHLLDSMSTVMGVTIFKSPVDVMDTVGTHQHEHNH